MDFFKEKVTVPKHTVFNEEAQRNIIYTWCEMEQFMVFNLKNNFNHIFRAYHYFLSTLISEIGKHNGFSLMGG